MNYLVEVSLKNSLKDHHGEHVRQEIAEAGIAGVSSVRYSQLYRLEGAVSGADIRRIAGELLIDPVTEQFAVTKAGAAAGAKRHAIDVWLKHGVTDTVAESVTKAVKDLGIEAPIVVKTGHRFAFPGSVSTETVKKIAERLLVNGIVQEYKYS